MAGKTEIQDMKDELRKKCEENKELRQELEIIKKPCLDVQRIRVLGGHTGPAYKEGCGMTMSENDDKALVLAALKAALQQWIRNAEPLQREANFSQKSHAVFCLLSGVQPITGKSRISLASTLQALEFYRILNV
ncbi:MAG: hypothetical protein HFE75_01870 [Firmicutes bacterium]|nr:hypothetical protein [Bacillota bacterium]